MKIGGNIKAVIQVLEAKQNEIGEDTAVWVDELSDVTGWLDLSNGDSGNTNFNAKIQESTHVFMCDYFPLMFKGEEITPENSRMVINNRVYEVELYDNPMGMNQHLEIYLKYVGGQ